MTRKKRKYKVATNPSLLTCLEPKSTNQRVYINSIHKSDIIFCSGPAGSGKTAISVGLACQYLINKQVDSVLGVTPNILTDISENLDEFMQTLGYTKTGQTFKRIEK